MKRLFTQKGAVSNVLGVPASIPRPPYVSNGGIDPFSGTSVSKFVLGSPELDRMRAACREAGDTLEYAGSLVEPDVTTDHIDRLVHEHVIRRGIYPSPLGYRDFPKSLCSSVNEVQCHGIPDDRPLVQGDIVNLDVSTFVNGYHGDTSSTFAVGTVSDEARKLMEVTKACLLECIQACGPGVPLNTVGAIVSRVADFNGYETSRTFCGHGIGDTFHMLPYVLHFANSDHFVLEEGHVFTIEPILCMGKEDHLIWEDGWTVASKDGKLSAQFEHTIVITPHGAEILT